MQLNQEKLDQVAIERSSLSIERAALRRANRNWLRMSQDIALGLHYYMRTTGANQSELAHKMGVTPVYVSKLLKGNENLTLETICKIQDAIGVSIVSVTKPYISRIALKAAPNIVFSSNSVKSDRYCDQQVSKKDYIIASCDAA